MIGITIMEKTLESNCISINCKNKAQGGNSYKTALCLICRKYLIGKHGLHVACTVCNKDMFIKIKSGGPRKVCSEECAEKRRSVLAKIRYRNANPIQKICKVCNKKITRKVEHRKKRVFCSIACYKKSEYKRTLYKRMYKKQLKIIQLTINMIKTMNKRHDKNY